MHKSKATSCAVYTSQMLDKQMVEITYPRHRILLRWSSFLCSHGQSCSVSNGVFPLQTGPIINIRTDSDKSYVKLLTAPGNSGIVGKKSPNPTVKTRCFAPRTRVEPSARVTVTDQVLVWGSCRALDTKEDVQTLRSRAST